MALRFSTGCSVLALSLVVSPEIFAQESQTKKALQRGTLEEVVVTARKREENIQETPIAVTAMSGEAIKEQGIENVQDLSKSVPSLQVNKGQSNQIYIRGIGERSGFVRVDPTVGVYLDDLFLPRADGQLLDAVDVRSLQVLRGPQGTLFGKNTTGGALVLSLEKPNEEFSGYVEGVLGNYKTRAARAGLNIPITDNFYTRIALNVSKNEGYVEDKGEGSNNNSTDGYSALFQTRWDASDSFHLDTLLFYGESHAKIQNSNCNIGNDDALFVDGLGLMFPGDTDGRVGVAYRENCENNSRANQGDLTTDKGPNALLDHDFESLLFGVTAEWEINENYTLKAVLGARTATEGPIQSSDNDGGRLDISEAISSEPSDRDSLSFELQLNSSFFDSRLNITSGLFLATEENNETFLLVSNAVGIDAFTLAQLANSEPNTRIRPVQRSPTETGMPLVGGLTGDPLLRNRFGLENSTQAIFVQGSYDVTDNFQVTLGARYTRETRESTLATTGTDYQDITDRLNAEQPGRFAAYLGPEARNLYTFTGTWLDDPVGLFYDVFDDRNGDGIPDYKYDEAGTVHYKEKEIFSQFTPLLSMSYVFDESILGDGFIDSAMVYFTQSAGFKSGFSEPRGQDGLGRVEPEEVDNTEIGFKIDAFERSLRLNVAAYWTDYKNIQLITVSQDSASTLIVVFNNAGEASIVGAELELQWLPFEGALFSFNYSNNNYSYQKFEDTNLPSLALNMEEVPVSRADETFPAAPSESASVGMQFSFPTPIGIITPRLDVSYKSEIFFGLDASSYQVYKDNPELAGADPYVLADARLTWMSEDATLRVTGYLKNIADERYIIGPVSVLDSLGTYNQIYGDPRTFGVSVTKEF